ncbi:unnamed protein product, partial [marine sediment metagenome]
MGSDNHTPGGSPRAQAVDGIPLPQQDRPATLEGVKDMAKHTRGPCSIVYNDPETLLPSGQLVNADGLVIMDGAVISGTELQRVIQDAAAAPELVEALRWAVGVMND